MWPVTARFTAALTQSHAVVSRIEAWRGDTYLGLIDGGEGSVSVTGRNRVRRTLDLTVPETYYPTEPDATLAPTGSELRVFRGIDFGDDQEYVPIFRGRILRVDDESRNDGVASVTCQDLFASVNDARFETPQAAPTGALNTTAIAALIAGAIPGAGVLNAATSHATVASGLSWDRDRGQAIDDLAQAAAAEVYADAGGTFVVRNQPTLADPVVWLPSDGGGSYPVIVKDTRNATREGVYNVVVTVVERPDGQPPIRSVVADTDPTSPTWVGGAFGRVPRFFKSPLITTLAQADAAGRALLARSLGLARTRTVTCVPHPGLEVGDRLDVTVEGVLEQHIADAFTIPLTAAGGAMTIQTRSTRPDAGDSS